MNRFRFANFGVAFLVQKCAEFVALSALLVMQIYLDASDPATIRALGNNIPAIDAIKAGVAGAFVFFAFTLYPVVTFVVVAMHRKFSETPSPLVLPLVSTLVSVGYVAFWVTTTSFPASFHFWINTAIMAAFIFVTSWVLYPPRRVATSGIA